MPSLGPLSVFEDAGDAVVAFTEDGVCVYANDSALRLYRAPDLVGRRIGTLRTRRSAAVEAAQWSRFRRDRRLTDDVEIQLPDGGHTRLRFSAVADYVPGVHLALVHPFDGVAEHRRVAALTRLQAPGALYRAAFENSPQGAVVADGERRLVLANRSARGILGVTRQDLQERKLDDFVPTEARRDLDRIWARFLERGALEGTAPLVGAHQLRRTIQFTAKADIVPGRHISVFSIVGASQQPSEPMSEDSRAEPLTAREREALTLLARGGTGETIAQYTGLSPDTVRTHLRNAMRKLDAHTRTHAIAIAMKRREIEP
ncbi:MAG: formate hydrogenlyase transcriptional activator [Frankiaceae bacterium]|nr:formate hydrogenlyase transcriptional activator [Frankiaceae bacterium]